jgi:ATP-dependent Clp protease ATP-binding subunit ClpA
MFSRFTQRARNVLAAAGRIADHHKDAVRIDAAHIAAGLLSEPEGLAARVIHTAGISDDELYAAFGVQAAPGGGDADAKDIHSLRITSAGKAVLKGALKAALRLGHNYIGTEHLLLGILFAEGDAAQPFTAAGLDVGRVEAWLTEAFAKIQAERRPKG